MVKRFSSPNMAPGASWVQPRVPARWAYEPPSSGTARPEGLNPRSGAPNPAPPPRTRVMPRGAWRAVPRGAWRAGGGRRRHDAASTSTANTQHPRDCDLLLGIVNALVSLHLHVSSPAAISSNNLYCIWAVPSLAVGSSHKQQ
jgi:hypothetical protein